MKPPEGTTLAEVLDGYRESGFAGDFGTLDGARIRCETCGSEIAAAQFVIESLRRLEGASDPDDMLAVVATCCPVCSAQGTLVLGYGPMASSDDADVSVALQDGRPPGLEGDAPQVSTPPLVGTPPAPGTGTGQT